MSSLVIRIEWTEEAASKTFSKLSSTPKDSKDETSVDASKILCSSRRFGFVKQGFLC
jgi:hypothetical protein